MQYIENDLNIISQEKKIAYAKRVCYSLINDIILNFYNLSSAVGPYNPGTLFPVDLK